ncbi:MAG: ABC transporter permease [Candidatus Aquicultor sp.]|nr:ABC transporter permease [Candidatus Aquicultor sp.]
MRRILMLAKKEFIQLKRDKRMIPLVFIAPLIQLLLFGYVVQTEIKNIDMVVVDSDRSAESRVLTEKFVNAGYFKIAARVDGEGQIAEYIRADEATIGVIIPSGYRDAIASGRTAEVMLVVDGSDSNAGVQAQQFAVRIIASRSQELMEERLSAVRAIAPKISTVEPRIRVWYNPDLKSVNFMIPGLMGLIITIITTLVTSLAIVKERERGTLEQLIVSPISRAELISGKILPFVLIAFIEIGLVLALGIGWFGVPFRGNVFLLLLLCVAFLFTTVGQGLFVSTVSRTQNQALMTTWFFMMPAMMLSGFIFPIANMPVVIQWFTYVVPLRYFLVIVRGIFLKGVGIGALWDEALMLMLLGVLIFGVSVLRFKKRFAD